ncbi:MAG: hypothetical protein ABIV13_06335, partial [Fimbriimonadales bacterium]
RLREAVLNNPKDAVRVMFDPLFEGALNDILDDNQEFYKKVMDNASLHAELKAKLFETIYRDLIRYDADAQ